MRAYYVNLSVVLILIMSASTLADCPLDHLLIGCNPDGIAGTDDDMKLFVDCTMKYRHSDPNNSGEATWLNWYYPLYYNERYDRYQIDEPGFELIEDNDPNRRLKGIPDVDHRIIVRCLSIAPGFAVWNSSIGVIFDEPGDIFDYSGSWDSHLHLQYRTAAPVGETGLFWVTFQIYDEIAGLSQYEVSEPFTIVFDGEPLAGDLAVDGTVDVKDLVEFSYYWLGDGGCRANDYYERTDANRDGKVDFCDFALMASNWENSVLPNNAQVHLMFGTTKKNRSVPQRRKFPPCLPKFTPLPKRFFSQDNPKESICPVSLYNPDEAKKGVAGCRP